MEKPIFVDKNSFLCPHSRYYGSPKPENLLFNANLQEFAQKISYIVNLQTGGKLGSEEAYERIEALWKQLELSQEQLGIGAEFNKHSGGL